MQDYKVMQSESMRIFRLLREKAAYEEQKKKKKWQKKRKRGRLFMNGNQGFGNLHLH